jgi:hypothetical protein
MKCLRIYSTADGESHFDEVEIPTSSRQVHPSAAAFEVSANYTATRIRFTRIPSGAGQVVLLCHKFRLWLGGSRRRQHGHGGCRSVAIAATNMQRTVAMEFGT